MAQAAIHNQFEQLAVSKYNCGGLLLTLTHLPDCLGIAYAPNATEPDIAVPIVDFQQAVIERNKDTNTITLPHNKWKLR